MTTVNLQIHFRRFTFINQAAWGVHGSCATLRFFLNNSPRTPLDQDRRSSRIRKHCVDKLQNVSPNCHNIFVLTMTTALGRRFNLGLFIAKNGRHSYLLLWVTLYMPEI